MVRVISQGTEIATNPRRESVVLVMAEVTNIDHVTNVDAKVTILLHVARGHLLETGMQNMAPTRHHDKCHQANAT